MTLLYQNHSDWYDVKINEDQIWLHIITIEYDLVIFPKMRFFFTNLCYSTNKLPCIISYNCCPTLVLKTHCPACFRWFPALTHLIQTIAVQQKLVNLKSIEIRCDEHWVVNCNFGLFVFNYVRISPPFPSIFCCFDIKW